MEVKINLLNLKVVKEKTVKYELMQRVTSPIVARNVINKVLNLYERSEEVLALITLDTKNNITGVFEVSRGTINASLVHPREIFKRAMLNNSNAIMLFHNHPSGDPTPSLEDKNITNRIVDAGRILGINLLDHIIIGDKENFYSFKENCLI